MDAQYIQAISGLCKPIQLLLSSISLVEPVNEICLRINQPISLYTKSYAFVVSKDGQPSSSLNDNLYIVSQSDIDESIKVMTNYSIHTWQPNINSGFITLNGGHRAGICGTCSTNSISEQFTNQFTTVNLRVARQIIGASHQFIKHVYSDGICSSLIIGSPSCGKTTLIRDLSATLSHFKRNNYIKVALVDSREELACCRNGVPQFDFGTNCDILSGYTKADAIEIAIRSLSPHMIIIDEIGNHSDFIAIEQSIFSGVKFTATMHASCVEELLCKTDIKKLLHNNAFQKIIVMHDRSNVGHIKQILDVRDIL